MNEWVVRWTNASVNQWITGSVNQRIKECNANKPKNQWIHESMNEGMDGWMERMDGRGIFFAELLLHWATSLLRHLFAQLLLLWAATYLGYFCSELLCSFCNPSLLFAQLLYNAFTPAAIPHRTGVALWSRIAFRAAVTMHLATSSCNPAC